MKVLVIGELNVDLILDDFSSFPSIGKEILAQKMNITLGSSSAIFASNLSNLGNQVSFLGMTGKDYFGQFIIESLKSHNVDTSVIIQSDQYQTGVTIVLNANEDRANVTYPGAMAQLSGSMVNFEMLYNFDHLHISSYFLQPLLATSIPHLFRKARKYGLTTSFDMQWDPLERWKLPLTDILPHVNVFLPNETELLAVTQCESLEEAFKKLENYVNVTAVKQGSRGSVVYSKGRQDCAAAFHNPHVVDAIGAGDSFNAGYIHKFIRHMSLRECQEYGNLTGAISTTESGGTKALENKENREAIALHQFKIRL